MSSSVFHFFTRNCLYLAVWRSNLDRCTSNSEISPHSHLSISLHLVSLLSNSLCFEVYCHRHLFAVFAVITQIHSNCLDLGALFCMDPGGHWSCRFQVVLLENRNCHSISGDLMVELKPFILLNTFWDRSTTSVIVISLSSANVRD